MRRLAALLLALAPTTFAQTPPPKPCTSPEHRQFDFWLGQWEVTNPQGQVAGTNRIELIQDGCVLLETWTGAKGGTGTSFNMYAAADKQWHQTWVDNRGGRLELKGGLRGTRMVLEAKAPSAADPAKTVLQEISWEPSPDGSVRQVWRTSTDGGKQWSTQFDGTYRKAKS